MSSLYSVFLNWNYIVVIMLMMAGLYIIISNQNFIKKLVGLSIFQSSVFIFYISLGKVLGGTAPILTGVSDTVYSNPLPHVLILTAIVVGVATNALGLVLGLGKKLSLIKSKVVFITMGLVNLKMKSWQLLSVNMIFGLKI